MNYIRTQMRCAGLIVSTVAMKFAKGHVSISTWSPSLRLFDGSSTPEKSHLSIKPEISWRGSDFGLPLKLTSLDTPMVLLIVLHGARSVFMLTNMYPGKRGFRLLTKREAFLCVVLGMGRNVSNSYRCKLRSARRWLFGLNCIKYQWFIAPPRFCNRSLMSRLTVIWRLINLYFNKIIP